MSCRVADAWDTSLYDEEKANPVDSDTVHERHIPGPVVLS